MWYIFDINDNLVYDKNKSSKKKQLPCEVYPAFDAAKHKAIWHKSTTLPESYFVKYSNIIDSKFSSRTNK